MRIAVLGLGIQGKKRSALIGSELALTVDPFSLDAQYKRIEEVPLDAYDAAFACIPDDPKVEVLSYLLSHGKHVLVEKPLLPKNPEELARLRELSVRHKAVCYTAYNHRFEPHILHLKQVLDSGKLGKVYRVKFFYGNGTARDVRNSAWRDKDLGVLTDLGSHLLDWTLMLFGKPAEAPRILGAWTFENRAFDHFQFSYDPSTSVPSLEYEMTLLSWRNTFRCDVWAEKGSVHIDCLCKWGPSVFTLRTRKLPSGRPDEESSTLTCPDPTWQAEHEHFRQLCKKPTHNIDNDAWIHDQFSQLSHLLKR